MLLVPVMQGIINSYGWRTAYVLLAISVMLVVPTAAIVFQRHRPQDIGLLPDGETAKAQSGASTPNQKTPDSLVVDKEWASREWTLKTAMRTRRFWLLSIARSLELLCLQIYLTHQAAFFVDTGFDPLLAASIVGTVGIVGSCGKILWGTISDRIGREMTYTIAFTTGTVGVVTILSIHSGSPPWMPTFMA